MFTGCSDSSDGKAEASVKVDVEDTRESAEKTFKKMGNEIEKGAEKAKDKLEDAGDAIADKFDDAKDKLTDDDKGISVEVKKD